MISCFDKPVLSEAEGLGMSGAPFVLSPSKETNGGLIK